MKMHMKINMSKRVIVRLITFIFMLIAVFAAYYAIVNWRAQFTYNAATSSLISNIKESKKIDIDKNVLLTQQQQTDAQFNEALAQRMLLLPNLSKRINHNAEISRKLTEKLKEKNNSNISSKLRKNQPKANNNKKDEDETESSKPKLNNTQRNKVENLLKQNDKVDSQSYKNQQSQQDDSDQEKTTKRTKNSDGANKPW